MALGRQSVYLFLLDEQLLPFFFQVLASLHQLASSISNFIFFPRFQRFRQFFKGPGIVSNLQEQRKALNINPFSNKPARHKTHAPAFASFFAVATPVFDVSTATPWSQLPTPTQRLQHRCPIPKAQLQGRREACNTKEGYTKKIGPWCRTQQRIKNQVESAEEGDNVRDMTAIIGPLKQQRHGGSKQGSAIGLLWIQQALKASRKLSEGERTAGNGVCHWRWK